MDPNLTSISDEELIARIDAVLAAGQEQSDSVYRTYFEELLRRMCRRKSARDKS